MYQCSDRTCQCQYWWLECPLACLLVNSHWILTAFSTCLVHFTTGGLVVWSSPCLYVCQDQARGTWRSKPLNGVLTVNSCGKQVMMSLSLLSHVSRISSAPKLSRPWAMTMTCYWLDKTVKCTEMLKNTPHTPRWQAGKVLTGYIHAPPCPPRKLHNDYTMIMIMPRDPVKLMIQYKQYYQY